MVREHDGGEQVIQEVSLVSDLNRAERQLLRLADQGGMVEYRSHADDQIHDSVRGLLVTRLCIGAETKGLRGLHLDGLHITGTLDLSHAVVPFPLSFTRCVLTEGPIAADHADLQRLTLSGTQVLHARSDGVSVDLSNATVDGDLLLDDGFHATGQLRLTGLTTRGHVSLRGAQLSVVGGVALDAENANVGRGLIFDQPFRSNGEIRLRHCTVGGDMTLDGAVVSNRDGVSLNVENGTIAGNVELTSGFDAEGTISFRNARIGGVLRAETAVLRGGTGPALDADSIETGADLLLYGCTAHGAVTLMAAHIGDCLEIRGTSLEVDTGPTILADGARIGGVLRFDNGSQSRGVVRLAAASMSQLVCRDASLHNPGAVALMARGIVVRGEALMNAGLHVVGEFQISNASIGTQLDLTGAALEQPDGIALQAKGLRVDGDLLMRDLAIDGEVILEAATARELVLCGGAWEDSVVNVRGFGYSSLDPGPDEVGVDERLAWLNRGDYAPGAFDVLADAYQRAGYESAAQDVRIAKQRQRRRGLPRHERFIDRLWDLSVVYGYRTWRALAALVALMGLTAGAFLAARTHGAAPDLVYVGDQGEPPFYPLLYAADVVIPIVDLRHASLWAATGWHAAVAAGATAAGWVLTTTVAVGLSGVLARRD